MSHLVAFALGFLLGAAVTVTGVLWLALVSGGTVAGDGGGVIDDPGGGFG